jgi:hypothetical protein
MQTERGSSRCPDPSLIVSIHDVSTVTRPRVEEMLRDLEAAGAPVTSLLVIPDHHDRGRIDADPGFATWLQGAVSRGHEAVLHGYRHLRPRRSGEGLLTRWITRSYTAGEGEFFDLGEEEASSLLRRGREALRSCGTEPSGFIAPAWLLGKEAAAAVTREGFEYTTLIGSVTDCVSGRSFPARSMVYSVRAPWRTAASLGWNALLFSALRDAPLLRIGLHPPDWDHPSVRRQVLDRVRKASFRRRTVTYRQWLDLWRSSVHEGADT